MLYTRGIAGTATQGSPHNTVTPSDHPEILPAFCLPILEHTSSSLMPPNISDHPDILSVLCLLRPETVLHEKGKRLLG